MAHQTQAQYINIIQHRINTQGFIKTAEWYNSALNYYNSLGESTYNLTEAWAYHLHTRLNTQDDVAF